MWRIMTEQLHGVPIADSREIYAAAFKAGGYCGRDLANRSLPFGSAAPD
jgi:hypothetical protein